MDEVLHHINTGLHETNTDTQGNGMHIGFGRPVIDALILNHNIFLCNEAYVGTYVIF